MRLRPSHLALAGLAASLAGYLLGDRYAGRMPDHRGHRLVAFDDRPRARPLVRPRRALVAVLDGLRADAATGTRAYATLRMAGVCLRTDVGLPSLSRPSYTVLSTGLEQSRSGVRVNAEAAPSAAESVWEVARAQGLTVEGRSELPWWRELFPRGFGAYARYAAADDAFAAPLTADLTLVHPVYVDEAGHAWGAASPQYRAAVARVDRELSAALARLDLTRDLVVMTADHGHRDRGGHGGGGAAVREVITCFAGRGVARASGLRASDTRVVAPALAMLLGTRLPRHLRAVDDRLDDALALLDAGALGDAWVADRRAAVALARAANADALARWSHGATRSWEAFDAWLRAWQWLRGAAVALALAALTARAAGPSWRRAFAWSAAVAAAYVAVYGARAGGLDLTSVGARSTFVRTSLTSAALALAAGAALTWRAGALEVARRAATLTALALAASAAHVAAYGWPLGHPLPGALGTFAPYLLASLTAGGGAATALAAAGALAREGASRRARVGVDSRAS